VVSLIILFRVQDARCSSAAGSGGYEREGIDLGPPLAPAPTVVPPPPPRR